MLVCFPSKRSYSFLSFISLRPSRYVGLISLTTLEYDELSYRSLANRAFNIVPIYFSLFIVFYAGLFAHGDKAVGKFAGWREFVNERLFVGILFQ